MPSERLEVKNSFATYKRNLLVGKITLLSSVFASLHCFIDFYYGYLESALFDAAIAIVLFFCYTLNRLQFHLAAKVVALLFMNMAFACYASLVPKDVGVYMYYFPLMAASTSVFGARERSARYLFIAFPFLLLALLLVTDFKLLGDVGFYGDSGSKLFFVINVIS